MGENAELFTQDVHFRGEEEILSGSIVSTEDTPEQSDHKSSKPATPAGYILTGF